MRPLNHWVELLIAVAACLVLVSVTYPMWRAAMEQKDPAPVTVECGEWHTMEVVQHPTGVVIGQLRHCVRFIAVPE